MKTLLTLINLKKQEIDNIKKTLIKLELEKYQLDSALFVLRQDLINEQEAVAKNATIAYSYYNFAYVNKEKQNLLIEEISLLDNKIDLAQQKIYELYIQLKRYEIILEQKTQAAIYAQNREEQKQLDEIIIQKSQEE
jgi:flagellar biosynthesis chaperone FliJ